MNRLIQAVTLLIDVMSHDEREAVTAHLASYGAAPLPLASDLLRFVGSLFEPGAVLQVADIVAAAQKRDPSVTRKQVYNALGYLARRCVVRRLSQGRYAARPADAAEREGQPR